jgi:hypothetical protein
MNVCYRLELSQTECDELKALNGGRQGAEAQARADFTGCGRRRQRRADRKERRSGRIDRLLDQAPLRARESGRRHAKSRGLGQQVLAHDIRIAAMANEPLAPANPRPSSSFRVQAI